MGPPSAQERVVHRAQVYSSGGDPGVRLKPGTTATYKSTVPGEFNFHCSIHPSMKGKVVVE